MPVAPTLARYLDQTVTYETLFHEPTMSSMHTAEACRISGDCLAKAVLLRYNGDYLLAVLPASHQIDLLELREAIGEDVNIASESEIDELFADCVHGAVPPVGDCYDVEVLIDASMDGQPDIYFEGGDHATVVHVSQAQFARLTAGARHDRFSSHS